MALQGEEPVPAEEEGGPLLTVLPPPSLSVPAAGTAPHSPAPADWAEVMLRILLTRVRLAESVVSEGHNPVPNVVISSTCRSIIPFWDAVHFSPCCSLPAGVIFDLPRLFLRCFCLDLLCSGEGLDETSSTDRTHFIA